MDCEQHDGVFVQTLRCRNGNEITAASQIDVLATMSSPLRSQWQRDEFTTVVCTHSHCPRS